MGAPNKRFWAPPDLSQPASGYHHTLDSWLLAAFAISVRPKRWCDLGTGSGAIACALVRTLPESTGVAIERQEALWQHAAVNLAETGVTLIRGDLRFFPWREHCFDLLICNPPYFEKSRGRLNRETSRAEARHTIHGDLPSFARMTRIALTEDGSFSFVYPSDRLDPVLEQMTELGFHPRRRLEIRSFADEPPILTCMDTRQDSGEIDKRELILYDSHRAWSEAAIQFLESINDHASGIS